MFGQHYIDCHIVYWLVTNKNNLIKYDLNNKCVSLKAIEVPILDLETMSNINILKLRNEIERTLTEDKPEA